MNSRRDLDEEILLSFDAAAFCHEALEQIHRRLDETKFLLKVICEMLVPTDADRIDLQKDDSCRRTLAGAEQ